MFFFKKKFPVVTVVMIIFFWEIYVFYVLRRYVRNNGLKSL